MKIIWTSKNKQYCIIENNNGVNGLIGFEIKDNNPKIAIGGREGVVLFSNSNFHTVADYYLNEWSIDWESDSEDFMTEA